VKNKKCSRIKAGEEESAKGGGERAERGKNGN